MVEVPGGVIPPKSDGDYDAVLIQDTRTWTSEDPSTLPEPWKYYVLFEVLPGKQISSFHYWESHTTASSTQISGFGRKTSNSTTPNRFKVEVGSELDQMAVLMEDVVARPATDTCSVDAQSCGPGLWGSSSGSVVELCPVVPPGTRFIKLWLARDGQPSVHMCAVGVKVPAAEDSVSSLQSNGGIAPAAVGSSSTLAVFGDSSTPAESKNGRGAARPTYGRNVASSKYGSSSTPTVFGASNTPAIFKANSTIAVFGASSTPSMFDASSTPAMFGASSTPAMFGASNTPAMFGASSTSAMFGASSTPAMFGASSTPAVFGASSTPAVFGASSTPAVFGPSSTPAVLGASVPTEQRLGTGLTSTPQFEAHPKAVEMGYFVRILASRIFGVVVDVIRDNSKIIQSVKVREMMRAKTQALEKEHLNIYVFHMINLKVSPFPPGACCDISMHSEEELEVIQTDEVLMLHACMHVLGLFLWAFFFKACHPIITDVYRRLWQCFMFVMILSHRMFLFIIHYHVHIDIFITQKASGATLLYWAASLGHVKTATSFLANGACVNESKVLILPPISLNTL